MNYITDLKSFNAKEKTVCALGKFDGVHLGHQKLIKAVTEEANKRGCESLLFIIKGITEEILSEEERKEKLQKLGIDNVIVCDFTDDIRTTSAEDFLDKILLEKLNASVIVAGPDLRFGYEGKGNIDFLKEKQKNEKSFDLIIIEKETYKGDVISSTRIKKCIADGNIEDAKAMLG